MSDEKILIRRKGTFKSISGVNRILSVLLLSGALMLALVFVLSLINFGEDINMVIRRVSAVLIVAEGALAAMRIIGSLGREYSYEAGEEYFSVTDNNGDTEYFYYSEISSVNYSAISGRRGICGYLVEVVTGYRTVKYRFNFGTNAENFSTGATPFYCLEVNAGLRESEEFNADSSIIMEQFERMQKHQEVEKNKTTRAERESRLLESIQNDNKRIVPPTAKSAAPEELSEDISTPQEESK